jgi:hypothetical protein
MIEEGWFVTRVQQNMVRLEDKRNFARHMIRFRRQEGSLAVGDVFPEIGLINSHDRGSAYKMFAGFFRLACLNGMVVGEGSISQISIRHSGSVIDEVKQGAFDISNSMPALVEDIKEMKAIDLTQDEQFAFAKAAVELKYEKEHPIWETSERMLQPRRYSDNGKDLWSTFNNVQENLTKGGLRYFKHGHYDEEGMFHPASHQRTREIKSIHEDVKLNKALWTLAEEMKKIKAA